MGLTSGVANAPVLPAGWTPVNHSSGQTFVDATVGNWIYDYSPSQKKWANAKDKRGNLWVWIPRYTYIIGTDPTMHVKFSNGTTDDTSGGYKKQKAFTFGAQELTGIWVMKYEAYNDSNIPGSKPSQSSWRSIAVNDIFSKCLNLKTSITDDTTNTDSHLAKNSEWGAVSILAYAIGQGRPKINGDSSYRTGFTTNGSTNQSGSLDTTGETSTTGNPTGVFDMVGCGYEYVASYVNNGNGNLNTYCASLVNADAKYKDVFPVGTSDTRPANYAAAAGLSDGMMINETSTAGEGTTSWLNWMGNAADSNFPYSTYPVFIRGGNYYSSNAGLACFNSNTGNAYTNYGFRACFVNLNSAPLISGSDSNMGNKAAAFSVTYQVSDADGDPVTVTEKLNSTTLRTLSNAPQNSDLTASITQEQFNALAINTQHTITITATDTKGGVVTRTFTFTRVNSAPVISGSDQSLGDKSQPFSINYQVTDAEGDSVTVIERLNGTAIQTRTNVAQGTDLTITIDRDTLNSLTIGATNTISIEASDDKGNTSYRNYSFKRVNSAPELFAPAEGSLGLLTSAPSLTYRVSDPEGDTITITEKLNSNTIRSFEAQANTDYSLTLSLEQWVQLLLGATHTVEIIASDSLGATTKKTYTFTRNDDRVRLYTKTPIDTGDVAAQTIVVSGMFTVPTGAELLVEVTNNGFDAEPVWENATTEVVEGRAYTFTNATKTAATFGVGVRVTILKGSATSMIACSGYGGAFE